MTREILNRVAKSHRIDLSLYDHVDCHINDNYTKVVIHLFNLEIVGGKRRWCNTKTINISIAAISKRTWQQSINDLELEPMPEDYETPYGSCWIYELA